MRKIIILMIFMPACSLFIAPEPQPNKPDPVEEVKQIVVDKVKEVVKEPPKDAAGWAGWLITFIIAVGIVIVSYYLGREYNKSVKDEDKRKEDEKRREEADYFYRFFSLLSGENNTIPKERMLS